VLPSVEPNGAESYIRPQDLLLKAIDICLPAGVEGILEDKEACFVCIDGHAYALGLSWTWPPDRDAENLACIEQQDPALRRISQNRSI